MQDIIYIWKSEGQNIGHGSMTLHDGTHISWWPKEEKMFESMRMNQKPVEAKTHSTYLNDVESEGKRADFVIRIKEGNLKIADIKSWWTHFKVNTKYHLKDCNCCTVIFKALTEGGSEDIVKVKQHEFATTDNLKEYALKLQSSVEQQSSMEMQEDAKEEL